MIEYHGTCLDNQVNVVELNRFIFVECDAARLYYRVQGRTKYFTVYFKAEEYATLVMLKFNVQLQRKSPVL